MKYELTMTKRATKQLSKAPKSMKDAIDAKLNKLAENPYSEELDIKKLKGEEEAYRMRVRNWRVVYKLYNNELKIVVVKAGDRKEVYK